MKCDLLIIDPQVSFCDPQKGELYVPGADKDCERLATMIKRIGPRLNDIHVTLDTHHYFDIAHPSFWIGKDGKEPPPFTTITLESIRNGTWRTQVTAYLNRRTMRAHGKDRDGAEEYVAALAANKRYQLMIWPPHCLIGSPGAAVMPVVWEALHGFEVFHKTAWVDYVTKGSNFWTEHYSAVKAEVVDPEDPTTDLNMKLIGMLQNVDLIGISGEALSHCLKFTIEDIAGAFGKHNIKKFVFLEDTSSSVSGAEKQGEEFVINMKARGMQVARSTDFMA